MTKLFTLIFILFFFLNLTAQNESAYQKPVREKVYSAFLQDSIEIEAVLPKEIGLSQNISYPVVYLLDMQNGINYTYNLQTIDYLSMMSVMPSCIVVGVSFPGNKRNSWTNPGKSGGNADNLISFIIDELHPLLRQQYPVAEFNLLVGHSRTAIFSTYALSSRYDFFNGAIANSTSNFDFGDSLQQKQFEIFLEGIKGVKHNYFLCFSSGESKYGDPHEPYVDLFREYLKGHPLPDNLLWADYKEAVGHMAIPGLATGRPLAFIFSTYRLALENCLKIVNDSTYANLVPWKQYLEEYEKASASLGYTLHPDLVFFNSIASSYYNDYFGFFKENSLPFSTEVLEKAVAYYPNDYDLLTWLAANYVEMQQDDKAIAYRNKAIAAINHNSGLTLEEKNQLIEAVNLSVIIE